MKTYEGRAGRGFRAELLPPDDRPNVDSIACLGRWNLYLPGQHPFLTRFTLAVVHLRDSKSITPAKKHFPEATHEIDVFAVDPRFSEDLFASGSTAFLMPATHCVQFVAKDDREAVLVAEKMVCRLVDGLEFAEPSGISSARKLFAANVRAGV
jgi:hypothetical protein